MINIYELKDGEEGERVNLKAAYKWLINDMSYQDFRAFATLRFTSKNSTYPFSYRYAVSKKNDSPRRREEYLKYLMYKLIQNIETPGVEILEDIE